MMGWCPGPKQEDLMAQRAVTKVISISHKNKFLQNIDK
jgi:hypothetical protein